MSLRAFHIVFVTITTLLFALLAVWSFVLVVDRTGLVISLGVLSVVTAICLPIYGVYFYRKIRKIIV